MKNVGAHSAAANVTGPAPDREVAQQHGDRRTRQAVARLLLEQGPITAVAVAQALRLSPAAVRRHLDVLIADGEVAVREAPRRGRRTRGRPAKQFLLTEAGRARFEHAYDDLAVSVLRFLGDREGEHAVRAFAESRVASLVGDYRAAVTAKSTPGERARALASALTAEGYAASTRSVGSGEQLCQHHCPVAQVAAEFPQLCEAETAAFAELLGTHVQRLATIARGDAACTTHVPIVPVVGTSTNVDSIPPTSTTAGPDATTDRTQHVSPIPHGGEPA